MEYPKGFEGERMREICALRCGDYGEPACWRLPELTSDCQPDEITPCDECRDEALLRADPPPVLD